MTDLKNLLRSLRTKRGLTRGQVAAALRVSGSLVAAWEQGRLVPRDDMAAKLDELFSAGSDIQQAAEVARAELNPWLRPWMDQEERAVMLRTFEPLVIPGLLQTEAYARAVIASSPRMASRVDEAAGRRLRRQAAALDRDDPVTLAAIIGEPALLVGDPTIMRPQLEHLVTVSHRATVHVRVVPMSTGLHAGLGGPFVIATLPDGRGTAYLDDQLRGRVVPDAPDMAELGRAWEAVSELALPADQSRDLILKVSHEYH